ncbi:MAG: NADAR family protein [Clostridia bacterium]|jgi:hypothetical protein
MDIKFFTGEFRWLSNFHECHIIVDGIEFTSVEHAYQAFKTKDSAWFERVRLAKNPGFAKRMGRQCPMREDWDQIKEDVMKKCVYAKFSQNETLKQQLLNTGDCIIEEGNTWGDRFWGVVSGIGENRLGHILMQVRKELNKNILVTKT